MQKPTSASTFVTAIVVGSAIILSLFRAFLFADPRYTLWFDNFDPRLLYWIFSWGHHAIVSSSDTFFEANASYPNHNTLAYSDSLLSAQLLYTPLRLLGMHPLLAIYVTSAAFLLLGVLATAFAARRFDDISLSEIALILVCSHATLCITHLMGHYQLFGMHLVPSCILYTYHYLRRSNVLDGLYALGLFCAAFGYAIYAGPITLVFIFFLLLIVVIPRFWHSGVLSTLRSFGIFFPALCIGIGIAVYLIYAHAYFEVASEFPAQDLEETSVYSANLSSLFRDISFRSYWYAQYSASGPGNGQRSHFPGVILIGMLVLYTVQCCYRVAKGTFQKFTAIDTVAILVIFVAYSFSLGPFLKSDHNIKLPFYYFAQWIPGLGSFRAVGRFGILYGLGLGLAAVSLLRNITTDTTHRVVVLGLALLIAVENITTSQVSAFTFDKELYTQVATHTADQSVLLELPVAGNDHYDTLSIVMDQLVGSTQHWRKLFVGYGAKFSKHHHHLLYLDQLVQRGTIPPKELLNWAIAQGADSLLLHNERYSQAALQQWKRELGELGATRSYEAPHATLYTLPGRPEPEAPK